MSLKYSIMANKVVIGQCCWRFVGAHWGASRGSNSGLHLGREHPDETTVEFMWRRPYPASRGNNSGTCLRREHPEETTGEFTWEDRIQMKLQWETVGGRPYHWKRELHMDQRLGNLGIGNQQASMQQATNVYMHNS